MKHKIYTKALAMLLVSASILSTSSAIYANEKIEFSDTKIEERATSSSGTSSTWVGGKYYTWNTLIEVGSGKAKGGTYIKANKTVPAGYMGAHANMYNAATGKVVATSDWRTNPVASIGYGNMTWETTSPGRYMTKGTVKIYNGNGYNVYGAKHSPELNLRSLNIEISDEELKERNHLYKSKNMIAAEGVGCVDGYVSLDDLYNTENEPNTPEEFLQMQKNAKSYRMIPLYSNDGETVIGEYRIDAGIDIVE